MDEADPWRIEAWDFIRKRRTEQMVQALKSGLHYPPVDIEAEVEAILARKAAMKEAMEARRKPKSEDKFHC